MTSTALVPVADGRCVRTETALELAPDLSAEEWATIGTSLGRAHRASAWWIGDWINYGEDAGYIAREKYDEAERITGMARQTLRNRAAVARRFESYRRRYDLVFGHHATVAALPPSEQDSVLVAAASANWTIERLREETRTAKSARYISPARRHTSVVAAAADLAKVAERWDAEMCVALTPPQARKQLTVLNKAAERLAEVISAVEYRAAVPHQFMGR